MFPALAAENVQLDEMFPTNVGTIVTPEFTLNKEGNPATVVAGLFESKLTIAETSTDVAEIMVIKIS